MSKSNTHSNDTIVASAISVNENVNTNKMIQQSVNVQAPPPRLHPKKRKFDLSELEDDHQQQQQLHQNVTSSSTTVTSVPSPVIISSHPTNSTSTTVVYQKFPSEMSSNNQNGNQQHVLTSISSSYNPHVVTQVVKNTGEVQQIIKRQSYSYR